MALKKNDIIDLRIVFKELKRRRKLYFIILPIVLVLSYLLILDVPRYYRTNMSLAPEIESLNTGGTLSNLASSFGIDVNDMQTSDAISPMLYPDLMEDNGFVTSLFNVHVRNVDGSIDTDYYTYLTQLQKRPWWTPVMNAITNLFKSNTEEASNDPQAEFDPYNIPKSMENVCSVIRSKIQLNFDKKTGVVSILVEDQDAAICRTIADSVSTHLQAFITNYRTNKARIDAEYYRNMVEAAFHEYDSISRLYANVYDANANAVLKSVRNHIEDIEKEMQMKYNAYTAYSAQLQNSEARIQERTPAFTVLKGASRPNYIAGPKRLIFAIEMVLFAFFIITLYIVKDYIFGRLKEQEDS
jgi:hypothetical protein